MAMAMQLTQSVTPKSSLKFLCWYIDLCYVMLNAFKCIFNRIY